MKEQKVVAYKNFPARYPLVRSLVFWLALDKINAPGWAWGVVGTIMVFVWISAIIGVFNQKEVEIL